MGGQFAGHIGQQVPTNEYVRLEGRLPSDDIDRNRLKLARDGRLPTNI
jgi:hypothetical protein